MKSAGKLIRRFAGILLLSSLFLLIINFIGLAVLMVWQAPDAAASPYRIAAETGKALQETENNHYILSKEISTKLASQNVWAILIDNDTANVVWQTDNVPATIPSHYTLSEIADLSVGYLDDYPTYIGKQEKGIVVLGYPKDSFWKHTQASWNYSLIAHLPQIILGILLGNIIAISAIYIIANQKLLKSITPIIKGIQDLSAQKQVHILETGILSEISANLNQASSILCAQQEQLRKKEMARANWIAGVSHDIRTPLSMIMGYAGQLENADNLSKTEQKKAAAIVMQSRRIKNLIQDLNLASKLEYNMQPLNKKCENAVAIVRQVVVDFMNLDRNDIFPIIWKTDDTLSVCGINADKNLLKRALENLIQNSMNHNENGCTIYVSVTADKENCIICVEDNGVGVLEEQIDKLNHIPHYMFCDANIDMPRHGLGLLIVKQIMEVHNGTVLINHSAYGGFKTVLTLPTALFPDSYKRKS